MQRNFSFLTDITDDDKRLLSRFLDWTEMAEEKYITKHSAFLDERQCRLCEKVMASVKYENYLLWGGYEGAERKMLCVYPQYGDENIIESFPMQAVTFRFRLEDKLSHRDFLGSLMALGITRGCVGDILVNSGSASVFVKDTVVRDVLGISKIGRVGVKTGAQIAAADAHLDHGFEALALLVHDFAGMHFFGEGADLFQLRYVELPLVLAVSDDAPAQLAAGELV